MNKKRLILLSLAFWAPVIAFCYIAGEILERQPILFDTSVLHWIHAHSSQGLDRLFVIITTLGNAEIIAPLALVICTVLWLQKQRRATVVVFSSFFGAAAANFILKILFHRNRPNFWHSAIHETGYSFPSGHAMISSTLVFSLIAVAWPTRWRWPVIVIGLLGMVLIGYSRLYLGVHYPTDIIAGWLASAIWVFIVTTAVWNQTSLRHILIRIGRR